MKRVRPHHDPGLAARVLRHALLVVQVVVLALGGTFVPVPAAFAAGADSPIAQVAPQGERDLTLGRAREGTLERGLERGGQARGSRDGRDGRDAAHLLALPSFVSLAVAPAPLTGARLDSVPEAKASRLRFVLPAPRGPPTHG